MHSHPALNVTVEAGIDHIIKAGGQVVIMPDESHSLPTSELVVTPRQPSKRQRQASRDFCKSRYSPCGACGVRADSQELLHSEAKDALPSTNGSGCT